MNKTVLVIEDNLDIRENVAEILDLAGYTVYQAENGKTGVEMAIETLPDIILCDIMMPELDGYGVLHILNKNAKTAATPFIFLSAKAEHIDLRKGMEMGADDYLTKPFDDIELLNAVETRLKKQHQQQRFHSKALDQFDKLVSKQEGLLALKNVIEERKQKLFKKNQTIYYEGDKGTGLYLIISGRIKSVKLAEDGRELMTGMYAADEYLGVNAILADDCYSETATALEDSILCLIPKEMLDNLLNLYPDVARKFIKLLADNVREMEEHLLQLAYHSVRKKLASSILRLHDKEPGGSGSFKIAREDLAAMAGMATETVSRTLADFKEEGLIEKKGASIIVLDEESLLKMKN